MRLLSSRTLRYFGQRAKELAHNFENAHHPYEERQGGRSWEDYYRRRWQHDKVVRSSRTGSSYGRPRRPITPRLTRISPTTSLAAVPAASRPRGTSTALCA